MGYNKFNKLADQLNCIGDDYKNRLKTNKYDSSDFFLLMFDQVWSNTSGGFEGIGCDMITTQKTFILQPKKGVEEDYIVYFDGSYAYSVPTDNKKFVDDIKRQKVAGVYTAKKRYKI